MEILFALIMDIKGYVQNLVFQETLHTKNLLVTIYKSNFLDQYFEFFLNVIRSYVVYLKIASVNIQMYIEIEIYSLWGRHF